MRWDPRPEPPTRRNSLRRALLALASAVLRPLVKPSRRRTGPPRILLVRPDNIGDVLLTSPALDLIQRSAPGAEVVYLVGPWAAEAAARGPLGHSIRELRFPGFARRSKRHALEPYLVLLTEARRHRLERFDAAVLLRPDHWWGALLALAAGIPIRVGYQTPETAPLLTDGLPLSPHAHAVEQSLRLAEHVLERLDVPRQGMGRTTRFKLTSADVWAGEGLLERLGLGSRPFVVLHPGAGSALKSWPARRWTALIEQLRMRGLALLLSGGPGEEAELRRIAESSPEAVPLLSGQPLPTVAAVLRSAALAVGPDSGIMHLAAAVGTPTVRLYGPAPPAVFGPDPSATDQMVLITDALPCVPCGSLLNPPCGATTEPPCMLALDVDLVVRAVDTVLAESGGPRT